jgi:hypothetical protein
MTVLTFPTSPIIGQRYNAPNEIQYVFDGVKWIVETVATTSAAVTNSVQDRVAPMFVAGPNTGIAFTYNAGTNVMSASVTAVNGNQLVNGLQSLTLEANGNITAPAFTIPNTAGTSGQVLKWPGSGSTLVWAADSSTTNKLVNGVNEVVLGADGVLTLPASGDINIPNGRANVTGTANTVGGGATVGVRSILAIDSAFGSNDANAPASAQAIRGRVTGSNLTKTRNYIAGVTGQYLVTGTNASEFINTGLLGVVGDQTTTADAAVVAYLDGDGGLTTAGSAYGVSMKNSTPGSGFDYGLDLQFIDLNVAGTTAPFKQADIRFNNGAIQRDTATVTCAGNASTVVYTASGQVQHTVKLLIQVEGEVGAAAGWDTQACEMIIAKSFRDNDVAATVYAVVHTSVAPLATFSAEWNALTSRIQVLCATPSANSVYVRIFATEIYTAD